MSGQMFDCSAYEARFDVSTYASIPGRVRHSDPTTSHQAAALQRHTLAAQVRKALEDHPDGLTDWEIVDVLGLPDHKKPSVAKRRFDAGAVPCLYAGTSEQVTRPSRDGNPSIVWALP